jgi:hypothetical protein
MGKVRKGGRKIKEGIKLVPYAFLHIYSLYFLYTFFFDAFFSKPT